MPTRDQVLASVAKKFKQKPWDCPKCNAHFDAFNDLRHHGEAQHRIKREGRAAGELGDLVAHYMNLSDNKPKAKNGKYHCPECNLPFADPRPLGIHRSEAHGFIGMVQMQSIAQPNFIPAHKRDYSEAPKKRGPYKKGETALAVAEPQTIIVPEAVDIEPMNDEEAMLAQMSASHGAIQALRNALELVNLALAMQNMPPGQASSLLGTLGALGQMPKTRRKS